MASATFGLGETYVMRKLYKEKMKKIAQEEKAEEVMKGTNKEIHTITTGSEDKASSGCFSWLSKQQHGKISRISDSNDTEAEVANS